MRSALAQQNRRGRECLLRAGQRALQVREVARRLRLLEADARAEVRSEEGHGRDRELREAARGIRQREMDIQETRCRVALLQVYWERVEEMGRWAVNMCQIMCQFFLYPYHLLFIWLFSPWHTDRSLHYTPIHALYSQRFGGELPAPLHQEGTQPPRVNGLHYGILLSLELKCVLPIRRNANKKDRADGR